MSEPLTPSQLAELRRKHYNATVVGLRKPNPELAILRVQPDFPIPEHKPGQYTTLGLGAWEPRLPGCQEEQLQAGEETKLIRRSYSLSHPILAEDGELIPPGTLPWLEFYIVLVRFTETGKAPALTPRLFMLREGDRIHMGEKITGHFTLEGVRPDNTVLLLSTGTGEAPHNYLLWELLQRGHRGQILAACCVRYWRDLGYLETHKKLAARFPNYQYLPLTTREPETIHQKVYIQDLITSGQLERTLGRPLDPKQCHVFLCGNPKMIGVPTIDRATGAKTYPQPPGVIEILEARGFVADQGSRQRGNIHFEEYW
jgi:ferredoxin--NADP+ reductase